MKNLFITVIFIVLFSLIRFDSSFAGGLVYSTYLGGGNYDYGNAIAVDSAENAYITGVTYSADFPTTPGTYDASYNGGSIDIFVCKLNATGTGLVYSTYLGGGDIDGGYGIAIDSSGNAYITGNTYSADFPTTAGAFDTIYNGNSDVFISKLNPNGTGLVYSTYLGGGGSDYDFGITIDGSGNAYLTGYTFSFNFPTTPSAYDTSYNNGYDVFVSKLNPSGTALVYSTYLGGGSGDYGMDIAIDDLENAYITGQTLSADFPTTPGAFDTLLNGSGDSFISKINASGTGLVYSTYLGGGNTDVGENIVIDSSGNAYLTGYTWSTDFPTTSEAFDTLSNGSFDVYATKLNATGTVLIYSTYLGGGSDDVGHAIAVDGSGSVYLTGYTQSTDFPTTPGALDTLSSGSSDVYVAKLNATGTVLVYSTYWGGRSDDYGLDITLDNSGNAYITGDTWSNNFPTTPSAIDISLNGFRDAFVTKISAEYIPIELIDFQTTIENQNEVWKRY
jgi:hypothetical protein